MERAIRGLAALALAAVTAACTSTVDDTPPSPKPVLEKTAIKVAVMQMADAAPLFIARRNGYFAQEGLTVEPVFTPGALAALPALMNGRLDLAQTDYVATFQAHGKISVPLKLVGALSTVGPGAFGLLVKEDSKIQSVADLKGKKIAVNTLTSLGTLTTTAMLADAGMKPRDVAFTEMPFPEMERRLVERKVDAAWVPEPYLTDAVLHGGVRRFPDDVTARHLAGLPAGGWMATGDWSEKNPVPTYMKIDPATAGKTSLSTYPTAVDPQALQRVADLMREHRYVRDPVDVKTLLAAGS